MKRMSQSFTRLLAILIVPTVITACSSAGMKDGYGPRGEATFGSAYGYSDVNVEPGIYYVEYVDVYADDARRNARRRAVELCVAAGYSREINFTSEIRANGDLVIAKGTVQCGKPGQSLLVGQNEESRLKQRLAEIDSELLAYKGRLSEYVSDRFSIGSDSDPLLNLFSTFVEAPILASEEAELRSRITDLELEQTELRVALGRMIGSDVGDNASEGAGGMTQATEPNLSSSAPPSPQQLQSALAALGFDPGPVDGKIGPKTRDAIAKWQESVGERPTGTLDPAQRTALVESAEGEHGAPEQGVANQTGEGDSTATPAARSHAPAGGCAAQIAQFEEQADAVGEAMDEYNRRTSDELGLGGLGGCGPLVIGYHANRNYANLLNRCPEVDPTGELRAEVKKSTDAMAEGADRICAVDDWPRSLLSMEELIQRLRSLTPLDQWRL